MKVHCSTCDETFETLERADLTYTCPHCGAEIVWNPPMPGDPPTSVSFPYSTRDGNPLPVAIGADGETFVAETELPGPPRSIEDMAATAARIGDAIEAAGNARFREVMTAPASWNSDKPLAADAGGARDEVRCVALYLGFFSAAVLARVRGVEVRLRRRDDGLIVQANLFREGGGRLEDSHKVTFVELRSTDYAELLGRKRGEHTAEVLQLASKGPE